MGGTEVYVEALARELSKQGITNIIAAPSFNNQSYTYNQLSIRRFAISSEIKYLKEIYGEGDRLGVIEFGKILDQEQPDLIHFHAFTRGVSLRMVKLAKSRKIPVIFTYHTPTVSCQRGTLLQWGTQVCDGEIQLSKCTACTLQGLGVNRNIANIITYLPSIVSKTLTQINLSGGIWTALQMKELVNCRSQAFRSLMKEVDHIIAVCDWVKNILIINQVPSDKITVIRQGLCQEIREDLRQSVGNEQNKPLRLVFFGRIDPTKGIDILIEALMAEPKLNVTLDIYGISQSEFSSLYENNIEDLVQKDDRITLKNPVSSNMVVETMKEYDLLAVPSQWLETGPMVILEAFAAKVPVIGSNLGGIAELIKHDVNGLLVEANSIRSWTTVIGELCDNRNKLNTLKSGINPPPQMSLVADRMKLIYRTLIT
ncbi:glycosyltransferase [Geminocystis sp. NIES-3709]|nr:glycosyltransferase [Geminocystis sp. NIES-3709]